MMRDRTDTQGNSGYPEHRHDEGQDRHTGEFWLPGAPP